MKQLIFKLILPLTLFSFIFVTKWSYVKVEDGPDEVLHGFPLPYRCPGWHTSMSTQYFLTEMVFDLLVYFLFWLVLIYLVNRLLFTLKPHKFTVIVLWFVTGLTLCLPVLLATMPDNVFQAKRDFNYEEIDTGVQFMWDSESKSDYYNNFSEKGRGKP